MPFRQDVVCPRIEQTRVLLHTCPDPTLSTFSLLVCHTIDMADKNSQKPQETKGFRRNARKFLGIEPRSTSQDTSSFRKIFGGRSGSPASSNSGLLTSKSSTENQGRPLTSVEEAITSVPTVGAVHQQGMFVELGRISAEDLYNWPVHETPTRSVSSMSKEISSE